MAKNVTLTLLSFILFITGTVAQHQYANSEDSDPEATALLNTMDELLSSMPRIHALYEMNIFFPGEEVITTNGKFEQEGSKYLIELESYQIISDGELRWVYLMEDNEVNIYNVSTDDTPSTPIDFLQLYRSQDFVYRLSPEESADDESSIEFKPLDKYSDYTKVRLTLKKSTGVPVRVVLFEKNGSRTDLKIIEISAAQSFPQDHFVFIPSDYPDIHIEDLRID